MIYLILLLIGVFLISVVIPKRAFSRDEESVASVSVLIPARNEEERIGELLADIKKQGFEEILLVDDHSQDNTAQIARNAGVRVLELNDILGKKAAIIAGVKALKSEYIVQFDADVRVGPDYLKKLRSHLCEKPDMLVLPVAVKESALLLSEIQRHEQAALLAMNSFFKKPILANGANMVYRRSVFLELDPFRTNAEIPSGDDHYLLSKMLDEKRSVKTVLDAGLVVEVEAASPISGFFRQRIRWAGKLHKAWTMRYAFLTLLASQVLLAPAILLSILVMHGYNQSSFFFPASCTAIFCWYAAQYLMVCRMNRIIQRSSPVFSVLLASILFPYYAGAVLFLSIFVRPQWKGRRI